MITSLRAAIADYAQELFRAFHMLSNRRKKTFLGFFLLFIFSLGGIVVLFDRSFTTVVPASGGTLTEGVRGIPRFVNPLLAASDVDRDITTLVYSGLLRIGRGGDFIPDLAKSYSVSNDGLTYTFNLRDSLTWHDGRALTSDDIIFTIKKAQDPSLKSPKRANWEGVAVEAPDSKTVVFTLKHPYGPFLENATLCILPKHIWGSVDSESFPFNQFNTAAIGSGPYQIEQISRDGSGIPDRYTLKPFANYALGEAKISTLQIRFYPNEADLQVALLKNAVESMGTVAPDFAGTIVNPSTRIATSSRPLPRVFAVFFNQNSQPVLTSAAVRNALDRVVDRQAIITTIFGGYAAPLAGPIPPGSLGYSGGTSSPSSLSHQEQILKARSILAAAGWTQNPLTHIYEKVTITKSQKDKKDPGKKETSELAFSLSTADTPELKLAAGMIVDSWKELGARVLLNVFEIGDLNQNVIRPRKYDALFFGEIVGRDPDLFSFWHSSQRNDPGLNVAMYANPSADKLLEAARGSTERNVRAERYREFAEIIREDTPATFIYAPYFLYALPRALKGVELGSITVPSDRFLDINNWYINTERVWTAFAGPPQSAR